MDNKEVVIKATAENIDKEKGNIDEIKFMQSNGNVCKAVFGKHGTGTVLYLDNNKVVVGTNSKFLWTTEKVEVVDSANTKIEVNKKGSRYTFEAKDNENYSIIVKHRLNLLLIIPLGILIGALITGAVIKFNTPVIDDKSPVGDFSVGGKQEQVIDEKTKEEVPTISYAGYGRYTVSEERHDIEMYNPDDNFVDMRFTVTDDETGDVLARTDLVAPGKYVYANVMNYYKGKTGEHSITITIESFDQDGKQMNGMVEKSIIEVK